MIDILVLTVVIALIFNIESNLVFDGKFCLIHLRFYFMCVNNIVYCL